LGLIQLGDNCIEFVANHCDQCINVITSGLSTGNTICETQTRVVQIDSGVNNMSCESVKPTKLDECLQPIGYMRSIFNRKNGTPRQASICPQSKGFIDLNKCVFNNPDHCLQGLQHFSHIWILYNFHLNTNKKCHSKVRPPRLDGQSCGVFASRSPHRPNPIGLSLVKLDEVRVNYCFICELKDGLVYVSGIDILDGTPIIDIKPYIKQYDFPESAADCDQNTKNTDLTNDSPQPETEDTAEETRGGNDWIDGSVVSEVSVEFTTKSLQQLKNFHKRDDENVCKYCLKHLEGFEDSKNAIKNLLRADPRSVYRRNKCVDRLYYFTIDSLHITSWFDIETNVVEVLKIKPFVT
ncbi:unnamed protein product, partial [Medioppia subpectinata]